MALTPLYHNGGLAPPDVKVPARADAPVKVIRSEDLSMLGTKLVGMYGQYRTERRVAELQWLRNQRQYRGIYDPEVEAKLEEGRSRAYPKITRVKCITVQSKLMNLMFPGNERNWELHPAPDPDISEEDVREAIAAAQKRDQTAGTQSDPTDPDWVMAAVHQLMLDRADKLSVVIDDQMQELGGDQTYDYIALNREVVRSGIIYGLGLMRGPFARECKSVVWEMDPTKGIPMPKSMTVYRPVYEFLPIWDFYPDMTAKCLYDQDGYFIRKVFSKSGFLGLKKRPDFFGDQIDNYLQTHQSGNFMEEQFEFELRTMGVRTNVNQQKPNAQKYQIHIWVGKLDGHTLASVGCDVASDKLQEEIDAEIWMIDGYVICAKLDPWRELGEQVSMLHHFLYDEDDTSPIGFGLPSAMRDSQLMVCAATRMLLDNASITCGPNIEVNRDLLLPGSDMDRIDSYRVYYREGDGPEAQFPAVRNIQIDAHMADLMKIVELGLKFADAETFVGPANGADQSQMPSEPYRTAAGASMLKGDAAQPFKDMVRGFDSFTQSVVQSMIIFNRVFNPKKVHAGDYNVIARGATSLIAKEVKGMQADQLVVSLTPEEKLHVDGRKLLQIRLKARDMDDVMVSQSEADRRQKAQDQEQEEQEQQARELAQAQVRKLLTDGYKNIAAGQKNISAADAETISAFMNILEKGVTINAGAQQNPQAGDDGNPVDPAQDQGQQPGGGDDGAPAGAEFGGGQG